MVNQVGREDFVIPFRHGARLYAAANEPKRHLWIDGAGHYDYRKVAGDRYWQALGDFTTLIGNLDYGEDGRKNPS